MKFGFIGAGNVAQTLSRHLLKGGHEVVLSNSRGPETLTDVVAGLGTGAVAGTAREAAQQDFVVLSVGWPHVAAALASVDDWTGRVLIDATNRFENLDPVRIGNIDGITSSEIVTGLAKGACVVKAFSNVPMSWIEDDSDRKPRTVLFISGDLGEPKQKLAAVLEAVGFACVDLGSLSVGGRMQQVGGPLAGLNLNLLERLKL